MSSIYIHIPYCKQKCSYCNFYYKTNQKDLSLLIKSIIKEISLTKDYLKKKELISLYFGGGTPSLINNSSLNLILNKIREHYLITSKTEITIECNPEDLNEEKLKFLKKIGVNRLSIGVQSFKDEDLIFMNRSHNSKQALNSIENAKSVGFKNISIDLMYSLPNQSINDWKKNLKIAFELNIQHISSYSLSIEEKTKLRHLINKNILTELSDIDSQKHFQLLIDECKKNNFIQYEISNFGEKDCFSIHNKNYWMGQEYLGIGPSAHSFNGKSRRWNISNNTKYINHLKNNILPFDEEKLKNSDKFNEYIMTSLRTIWGVDLNTLRKRFGDEIYTNFSIQIKKWIKSKHLNIEKNKIFLTTKGKYISDTITSDFFIIN